LAPPKQLTLDEDETEAVSTAGCVIEKVEVALQEFASVACTVYVPAASVLMLLPVVPEGSHVNVYPGVPPKPVAVAVPSVPPLQLTSVVTAFTATGVGCVTVVVSAEGHPFASVTCTMCVPAESPVAVAVVLPEGVQLKTYGNTPPATVAVEVPFDPPLQLTLVVEVIVTTGPGVLLTDTLIVAAQLLLSVTVTL